MTTAPVFGEGSRRICLDLGCGRAKRPDCIGLDYRQLPGVDVVANLETPLPFGDDTLDAVYSKSVLEHVDGFETVMAELHRTVKPGGDIHIIVPHFSSPLSYSDFTHRRFFGYYTFDYFVPERFQTSPRKVPDFYVPYKFRIRSKRLRFVGAFHVLRHWLRLWEWLVNYSEKSVLLYESTLCYLIPCYCLEVRLSPIKSNILE